MLCDGVLSDLLCVDVDDVSVHFGPDGLPVCAASLCPQLHHELSAQLFGLEQSSARAVAADRRVLDVPVCCSAHLLASHTQTKQKQNTRKKTTHKTTTRHHNTLQQPPAPLCLLLGSPSSSPSETKQRPC